jgi:hypothetical protein
MKNYLSEFKKPIDPKNPFLFFSNISTEEEFNKFLNNLYHTNGLGFTKLDNGKYSFYAHTGFYNEHMDLIDSTELYEGSVYKNLEEILNFYYLEMGVLLEARKMNHLYESKKIDDNYSELLLNNIDSFLNNFKFIKDDSAKGIIIDTLHKFRRLVNNSLSYSFKTPISQEIIDYIPQYSYLLGEVKKTDVERIFITAESHFLIDSERTDLDTFFEVFSSTTQNQKTKQILFLPNRKTEITAFIYALKYLYKDFSLSKVELSEAFCYIEKNNAITRITQGALYTQYSRNKELPKFQFIYNTFKGDLKSQ